MAPYKWQPIQDLPARWQEIRVDEMESQALLWKERHNQLRQSKALKEFNERLKRESAIETGLIEGLYTIDRGLTQLLIEKGILQEVIPHGFNDKAPSEIVPLMQDQESVIEGLFDFVARSRTLSTSYIKEVQQALTRHQSHVDGVDGLGHYQRVEILRGAYKTLSNNPTRPDKTVHEYCPPVHVPQEMERLVEWHLEHSLAGVSPEVEAAWLHHRFTQIHPFQDGNGRVARALASLVFIRAGWFPLVVVSERHRTEYIRALETADAGQLADLINLFARLQKEAFRKALSLSEDVTAAPSPIDKILEGVVAKLQGKEIEAKKQRAFKTAEALKKTTLDELDRMREDLNKQLKGVGSGFHVTALKNDEESRHWYWNQAVASAKEFQYWADIRSYHGWVRLRIKEMRSADFVFSFHSLGREFLGLIAVTAFIEYRSHDKGSSQELEESLETNVEGPYIVCDEVFEFAHDQEESVVQARYRKWLERTLIRGLDMWRQQL